MSALLRFPDPIPLDVSFDGGATWAPLAARLTATVDHWPVPITPPLPPPPPSEPASTTHLRQASDALLSACAATFTTGEPYWRAAPAGGAYGQCWFSDLWIVSQARQDVFTPAVLAGLIRHAYAARSGADFPLSVNADGSGGYYSSGCLSASRGQPDGLWALVEFHYQYWLKTGDRSLFDAQAADLKAAMLAVPVSGGLVWVDPARPWVAWGYEDGVAKTGYDLFGSLMDRSASTKLVLLYGAGAEADYFFARRAATDTALWSVASGLWDAAAGIFSAASGANAQPDVFGSAFAAYSGAASDAQADAISDWLDAHHDQIAHPSGYVRQSPTNWAVSMGGNQCGRGTGNYDDGYWCYGHLWVLTALARRHPQRAGQLARALAAYYAGGGAKVEYIGAGNNGYPDQLTGAHGAYRWAADHPTLMTDPPPPPGTQRMARLFSSTNDRIEIGTTSVPATGSMVMRFYPTFAQGDGSSYVLFEADGAGSNNFSILKFASGNVFLAGFYDGGSGSRVNTGSYTLNQNAWNTVAVTWTNGGTLTCYLNGVSIGTASTITARTTTSLRTIGNVPGGGFPAGSRIADFAIFTVALTAAEVLAFHNGVSPEALRAGTYSTDDLPITGQQSPEPNVTGSTNGTVTGTTQADGPQYAAAGVNRAALPSGLSALG